MGPVIASGAHKCLGLTPRTTCLFSARLRNEWKIYWPGSGVRTKKELEEEIRRRKANKWPEENPSDYTIFGTKKITRDRMFHYSDRRAGRGYTDFAENHYHGRIYIWPGLRYMSSRYYLPLLLFLSVPLVVDFEWFWLNGKLLYEKYFKTDAAIITENEKEANEQQQHREDAAESDEQQEKKGTQIVLHDNNEVAHGHSTREDAQINCSIYESTILNKKKQTKIGFRERRIINYEDRIRAYSSPDKIFRYFATIKLLYEDGTFDIFMTPEDFVRSLTPGVIQPRKYGLDKYKVFNANQVRVQYSDKESIFYWLGNTGGLINFADYLFMMTLLSTSPSEFKLAFHVFDLNGDGSLDRQEFERVQELVLSQSNIGQRHRDHITGAGIFVKSSKNSAITRHFFGGNHKLDIDTFLKFQQDLHRDILKIEFERRDPESGPEGIISEISFAELLLIHSDLAEKRQKRMMKRVRERYRDAPDKKGVSFAEVSDFFAFIYHIDKVDLALHFYKLAGKSLSKQLIQRVARKITGVELSDTVVDIVVTLFDENRDGELSQREFVSIMNKRKQRGLERPKDTGLIRLMDAAWLCSKNQLSTALGSRQQQEQQKTHQTKKPKMNMPSQK